MDQRTRVLVVAGFVLLATAALGVQAATIDRGANAVQADDDETYPGNTLVGVHSWEEEGRLVEIDPDGEVVWAHEVEGSRFFGIHPLRAGQEAPGVTPEEDGNVVLFTVAEIVPAENCEEEHLEWDVGFGGGPDPRDHCVENRVVLMDRAAGEIVWEYSWRDEMIHWHEVHDAEVTDDGQVAIVDMGNNRAFTVNEAGEITWEWQMEPHLDEGSPFFEEHVTNSPHVDDPDEYAKDGEFDDWTHANDIDELENGNVQLSIRNYDTVIEVDPETDEIVGSVGKPGRTDVINEQHDPQRLEADGTLLVADSKNNRVVEVDAESEEVVWEYTGPEGDPLQWPRDADRLPNGNTLITDSRNNRVLEVNETGAVVWEFHDPDGEVIPLPYAANRIPVGEEADGPSATALDKAETDAEDHGLAGEIRRVETLSHWVLPNWMHLPQLINLLAVVVGGVWLAGEGVAYGLRRTRVVTRLRRRFGA